MRRGPRNAPRRRQALLEAQRNSMARWLGGLKRQMVKKAAPSRVFGFEIMPAPFVVAHLQVGLALHGTGATLGRPESLRESRIAGSLRGWDCAGQYRQPC